MKIRSVNKSAAVIASVVAVFLIPVALLLGLSLFRTLLLVLVAFAAIYAFAGFIISKFVVFRIKPIYQLVLSKNFKSSELGRGDEALKIEEQLTDWAETNRMEIARLKENERYRKEFLGNLSHEIKTPIFNVQGYILTLLDGALEDPQVNTKYLERAEKSIDRLINIVNDLQEISNLESSAISLNIERFDIAILAAEMVDSFEIQARERNIKLTVVQPIAPFFVYADKRYIGQVLANLLINSIKYGNENGYTKVSFIDMFDKIMVEVKDNGIGISKENTSRVFERFYRTDKSRSREMGGTGLGLAIVKHIIEAHNENITVRSELGSGTTFSFTLNKATSSPK